MKIGYLNSIGFLPLLLTLVYFNAFPQGLNLPGLPVIRNYLPREYKAHNQNWTIVEDNRGVLYFGNSSGVLEFDGYNWNLIKIPNGIVRSLSLDDEGTLFVGSADDFGYLTRKSNGELEYKSLISVINISEPIGHVWYTFNIKGTIFFITNRFIFSLSFKNKSYLNPEIKTWVAEGSFRIAHKVNSDLYILETTKGLLKFDGDSFELLPGSDIFKNNPVYSMLPFNDSGSEILMAAKQKGLFIYRAGNFLPFKTKADKFLAEKNIYLPGTKLTDGNFVINTSDGGIVILNRLGKIIRIIDTSIGIPDDGVLFVLQTKNKLWLALQNGISSIDIPWDVSYLNQSIGLKGSVSDIKIVNNFLYAASTAGIFKLGLNDQAGINTNFEKILGVPDEGWSIIDYKSSVITATTEGVILLGKNGPKKLNTKWRGSYYVYNSKVFPKRLYVGLENGLAVVDEVNGTWIDRGQIEGINTAIRNIEEDNKGNLWLGTPYNGVYKISNLSSDLKLQPVITQLSDEHIKPDEEVKIFPTNSGLLFATKKEVLVFDENSQSFRSESTIGFNTQFANSEVSYVLQDKDGKFWVSSVNASSEISIASASQNNGKYVWRDLSYLKSVIDFSNSNAVFTIYKDESRGIVWFCGADGIVSFNSNSLKKIDSQNASYRALITKVLLNSDSLLFAGDDFLREKINLMNDIELAHDYNSMRFEFSSLSYDGYLCRYQYYLDGLDHNWSVWSSENRKDYTNLSSGNYVFRIRAKDIYGNISDESSFTFSILSPWYFSWYAYLFYLVFLAFILYSIIKIRVNYLIQRNIKLESIIADRTKVISEQAEQLKELDEIKSRFFTNISHEFRTPLTLTLGQLESVMNSLQDFNLKKKLEMGYQNAKKLLRLINQLLEISKIESGKHTLHIVKKDIVSFVRHILFAFESIADQKGIALEFSSDKESSLLYFDTEKMDKVFTNLISNAIKFTSEGGRIGVQIREVKQVSIEEKNTVEILIEDTGIGIAKERLPFIFDRFYQADRSDRSDIEGTGIGLTLTKELIEIHSGKIEVQSEPDKGTTFKVVLLCGRDNFSNNEIDENILGRESEESVAELIDIQVKTETYFDIKDDVVDKESVLVIDDNSDIRQFIREQLEGSFTIFEANDGLIGIRLAKESIPNLIITDVRMPGMDGFELSKKLKADTLTSHIPIIILTAKSDQKDKLTGLETGADDYLVKPFSTKELTLRVKNLIELRKKLRERYSKTVNFTPDEVTESSLDQKFLAKIIDEVNYNISDDKFNSEVLANKCAISISQLNRKLNALIDQPAGHFIRSIKMEKAAKMLRNKEATVKEVAYSVGYRDQSNFSRSFKKHFGKTPGDFIMDNAQN